MYNTSHFNTRSPDCQRNTPQLAASHYTPRRNSFVTWLKLGITGAALFGASLPTLAADITPSVIGISQPVTTTTTPPPADPCATPTKVASLAAAPRKWEESATWEPRGVPTATDVVLIPEGVTITVSPLTVVGATEVNGIKIPTVTTLCLKGNIAAETLDSANVLLSENFEGGSLTGWVGSGGGAHSGQIVADPLNPSNHAINFKSVGVTGDIFKHALTNPSGKYLLSFDYLGLAKAGSVADELGGSVSYRISTVSGAGKGLAATVLNATSPADRNPSYTHLVDLGKWVHVTIPFTAESDIYLALADLNGRNSLGQSYSSSVLGLPGDSYFDNIKLTDTTISIKGKVYYDKNCNGRLDPTENGIPGVKLVIDSTKSSTHASDLYPDPITDGNGIYNLKGYDTLNSYSIFVNPPISEVCKDCIIPSRSNTYKLVGDTTVNIGIKPVESQCTNSQMTVLPIQTDVGEDSAIEVAFTDPAQNVTEYTLVLEVDGNRIIKTFAPVGAASAQPVVDTTSIDTLIPTLGADGLVHVKIPFTFEMGGSIPIKAQLISNQGIVGEETTTAVVRATAVSDSCAIGVATVASVISGDHNNPKTWGGRLPTKNDWVLVRNGHTVTFPTVPKVNKNAKIRFKGLCIEAGAKIHTKSYRKLNMAPPSLLNFVRKSSMQWRACPPPTPYMQLGNCTMDDGQTPRILGIDENITRTVVPAGATPTNPPNLFIPDGCKLEVPLVGDKADAIAAKDFCLARNAELVSSVPTVADPQFLAFKVDGEAQIDGNIIARDGQGTPGVNISIDAGTLNCGGNSLVQAGNGGGTKQNGGAVSLVSTQTPTIACKIKTGDGGDANAEGQTGGFPGDFEVIAMSGSCNFPAGSEMKAGRSGRSRHSGEAEAIGGRGAFELTTQELTASIGTSCGGATPHIIGGEGTYWNDPINISMDQNTQVSELKVGYWVTDKEGSITINGLQAGAVTAKKVVLSTGNLKINSIEDKAFVAEEEVQIFADNITLPSGKTLADFVSAPKFTQGAYKPLYYAQWSTPTKQIVQEPGTSVAIPLKLQNLGPTQDTYTVTVTDTAGWSLCKLPAQVLVNSLRSTELSCQMTLPQTRDVENFLTLKAVSQGDPSVEVTTVIYLKIPSESIYTASGTVLTGGNTPVANAAVQVGDTITFTDDKGYWEVPQLANGEYSAQVVVDGYTVEPVNFTIAGSNQQNITLNLPTLDVDNGLTLQSNMQTVISTSDGIVTLPGSLMPDLDDETVRIGIGKSLTTDGLANLLFSTVDSNGNVKFADATGLQLSVDPQGNMLGTDSANPQHEVTIAANGNITAKDKDKPDIVVTANADGSFTGTELSSKVSVTIDKHGQQVVTHPDFPGMQATVNADNTLTVTSSTDPEAANVAAVFNTQTGEYQVINLTDGTCYTEDSTQRGSFFRKVAGFISNAAGFVAKVANVVAPIAQVVSQVAGTVSKVAAFGVKVTTFLCPTCTPLIAGLGTVAAVSGTIAGVAGAVAAIAPKVASVAQKISDWFARWKSGRNLREGERAVSACETWRPTQEITDDTDPPAISYTLWGNLVNGSGNTISGVTVKVGELSATPDAQGYWEIKGLPEGEYEVTAEKAGLIFMPQTVELGSQEKVEVKFTPVTDTKLRVTANPRTPNQGDDITYVIDIINGTAQAMSGTLKDLLPAASLLNLTAPEGLTCAANDGTFECQLDNLMPGTTVQIRFTVSNLNAAPLTNKVELTSAQFSTAATATTVTKIRPYLSATCKTKPSPAIMFGNLAYDCSVQLSDKAPDAEVSDVVFSLNLPKSVTATQLPATCSANEGTISCALGTVARGAPVKLDSIKASLGTAMLLQLSTEFKVAGTNYPAAKDVVRTNVLLGDAKVDGIILLDTTGSMQDEMDAMTQAVEKVGIKPDTYVALVSFRDDVKLETLTSDRDELLKALKKLKADGGGECPEASAEALNLALDHIKPNGIIIFASDAPPYPGTDIEKLKARIIEKQANFIPILTKSDCAPNALTQ